MGKRPRKASEADLFGSATLFDSFTSSSKLGGSTEVVEEQVRNTIDNKYYMYEKFVTGGKVKGKGSPIDMAVTELRELIRAISIEMFLNTEAKTNAMKRLIAVADLIRGNPQIPARAIRHLLKFEIAVSNEIFDFYSNEIARVRKNVMEIEQFIEYIGKLPPYNVIQTQEFLVEIFSAPSRKDLLNKRTKKIDAKNTPFKVPSPNMNDIYTTFCDPSTKEGQIISRFRANFSDILIEDLSVILEALSKGFQREEVEEALFGFAWVISPFPFVTRTVEYLPDVTEIVPQVFDPPYLPKEYQLMTFGEIVRIDWPLKSATELLSQILFEINPFKIARIFWNVIDETGLCVQKIMFRKGKNSKGFEIDFDQLFSLLLVCIFASGLKELPVLMEYAACFRDISCDDPHIQYSMGHLDGITTYLKQINIQALHKKSQKLIMEDQETIDDPLGIQKK